MTSASPSVKVGNTYVAPERRGSRLPISTSRQKDPELSQGQFVFAHTVQRDADGPEAATRCSSVSYLMGCTKYRLDRRRPIW